MTKILLHEVVVCRDTQQAEYHLLRLSGLRKFLDRLKTERKQEDFRRHMRKYINIWLPDCPWEVSTTNRYTIVTQEASAIARRLITKGETIKYLCGNLVAMTAEEEKDLDLTRRDFSIVMSSRKKTPSLFLGPARFANHDCNANARLVTRGSEGMQVVAVRNIGIDEEITVTYGEDYFGIGNCECLCQTCELEGRNGWFNHAPSVSSSGDATPLTEEIGTGGGPYSFRRKRKYFESTGGMRTPDNTDMRPIKRRKSKSSASFSASGTWDAIFTTEQPQDIPLNHDKTISKIEVLRDEAMVTTSLDTPTQHCLLIPTTDNLKSTTFDTSGPLQISSSEFDIGWKDIQAKDVKPEHVSLIVSDMVSQSMRTTHLPHSQEIRPKDRLRLPKKKPILPNSRQDELQLSHSSSDVESIFDHDQPPGSSPASTLSRNQDDVGNWKHANLVEPEAEIADEEVHAGATSNSPADDCDIFSEFSDLSELSSAEELDDVNMTIIRKPMRKAKIHQHSLSSRRRELIELPGPALETPKLRRPGDYIRTTLLLSEPFARWVDCSTCSAVWVQANGYYTRKECPRCERHSKLYGYQWPKTESVKGEEVGRVMDHRTVHRFLRPEDEARVRKRGRGLAGVVTTAAVEESEGDGEVSMVEVEEKRTRGRKRRVIEMG